MLQLNHSQPPFNNPRVRQALAMAIDQNDFLKSAVSDPSLIRPCYSYYGTDSPYAGEAGADILKVRSLDKAKAALKAAGYAGEKIVILGVMESPVLAAMCQVAEDLMRRSDQWSFLQRGIPAIFFFTGLHPDYHTPRDTPEKINYPKLEKVTKLVYLTAFQVANASQRPQFVKSAPAAR